MSGTPQKILEHLLETRLQINQVVTTNDPFLDDFLLTHIVFMPIAKLVDELANQYPFPNDFSRFFSILFSDLFLKNLLKFSLTVDIYLS